MKTDPQEINRYLNESRNCAMQMIQNAAYMQKELPSLEMSDGLREEIGKLCDDLISTKHDLIGEIFECYELLAEDSDAPQIGKMINQIHQWMSGSVGSIQECVAAIQQSIAQGTAAPVLGMLVMESAVNIIKAVPALPENREESFDANEDDPFDEEEEEEDQDDEADRNEPNCYAFNCEDSYPVGQLIDGIRDVMARPEVTEEELEQLKVFLFAMERLPLVTPGVRMSLGLRLNQGGESDWIEIRMEDEILTLGRGSWVDGDADTETHFEVGLAYRDGDAFQASNFALSFISCAEDFCREVVIEDTSDEPFSGWELQKDKSRWSQLPSSFF